MKTVLTAINAKFIHSALAVHTIQQFCQNEAMDVMEFTINQSENFIIEKIYKKRPDIAAFSCYIWNIEIILHIASVLKKLLPCVKIILGGPEVSYEYETLMEKNPFLDVIVIGEGEKTFLEIMQGKDWHSIKGIFFRDRTQFTKTEARKPLENILFPYTRQNIDLFKNRILYYESARGCPYRCSYCLSSIEDNFITLPLDRVFSDMQFFLQHKVKQVKFVDRTFNVNKEFSTAVWKFLMQNDNQVTNFHFEISGDLLSKEQITLLQNARIGLFQFEIGVQSVQKKTLAAIHRNADVDKILENVKRIKKSNNIHVHLDLIAGLPKESFIQFKQSFDACFNARPDMLQLGFLKILKGSKIKEESKTYGLVYKEHPPYEILFTNDLYYDEIIRLRHIENIVEKYYNSALTPLSLQFILMQHMPFAFFEKFSRYFEENHYDTLSLGKMSLYTIFYEFTKQFVNDAILKELLKFDMLLNDNIKTPPYFMEQKEVKTKKNKMSRIEIFSYDVLKFETDHILEKREVAVLFDYANRDKASGKARKGECHECKRKD